MRQLRRRTTVTVISSTLAAGSDCSGAYLIRGTPFERWKETFIKDPIAHVCPLLSAFIINPPPQSRVKRFPHVEREYVCVCVCPHILIGACMLVAGGGNREREAWAEARPPETISRLNLLGGEGRRGLPV